MQLSVIQIMCKWGGGGGTWANSWKKQQKTPTRKLLRDNVLCVLTKYPRLPRFLHEPEGKKNGIDLPPLTLAIQLAESFIPSGQTIGTPLPLHGKDGKTKNYCKKMEPTHPG